MKNLLFMGFVLISLNSFAFVTISNPGDSIFKQGNGYIVRVTKPGTVNVVVYAMINGKKRMMGTMPFRVKRVPDPIAKVGGFNSGSIPKTTLLAQTKIDAVMENFEFNAKFRITRFTVSTNYNDFDISTTCNGNNFNDEVMKILKKAKRGSRVYFEDIRAIGPDGSTRNLGSVVLKVI